MTPPTLNTQWTETLHIWRENAWLFGIVGWLLGLLTLPLIERLTTDAAALLRDMVPVALVGVVIVTAVDGLLRRRDRARLAKMAARDRQQTLQRILRELRSRDNVLARVAAEEAVSLGFVRDGSLVGVRLWQANLRGANLHGANLQQADLQEANLGLSVLRFAELREADLRYANLAGADMQSAKLHKADLRDASLTGADLWQAQLVDAELRDSSLVRAFLLGANLEGADLSRANLSGAFLRGANLYEADLDHATFDETTVLPDAEIIGSDGDEAIYDKTWTPNTDMTRYTDPDHPDFWQPEWAAAGYWNHGAWSLAGKPPPK